MDPRQLRILRGSAASSSATFLAALSHTLGGGAPPHPLLILAVSVLLAPLTALLVGCRTRLRGIAVAVGATQGLFHALFEVTGSASAHRPLLAPHQHGEIVLLAQASHHGGSSMIWAHLVAAALTTLLLWRGELMVKIIAQWVRAVLRRSDPQSLMPASGRRAFPGSSHVLVNGHAAAHIRRRGPPLLSCG